MSTSENAPNGKDLAAWDFDGEIKGSGWQRATVPRAVYALERAAPVRGYLVGGQIVDRELAVIVQLTRPTWGRSFSGGLVLAEADDRIIVAGIPEFATYQRLYADPAYAEIYFELAFKRGEGGWKLWIGTAQAPRKTVQQRAMDRIVALETAEQKAREDLARRELEARALQEAAAKTAMADADRLELERLRAELAARTPPAAAGEDATTRKPEASAGG